MLGNKIRELRKEAKYTMNVSSCQHIFWKNCDFCVDNDTNK